MWYNNVILVSTALVFGMVHLFLEGGIFQFNFNYILGIGSVNKQWEIPSVQLCRRMLYLWSTLSFLKLTAWSVGFWGFFWFYLNRDDFWYSFDSERSDFIFKTDLSHITRFFSVTSVALQWPRKLGYVCSIH